ncbi:hypothetical protein ACFOUP_16570 [Belliella kenyensis]|uniref:FUSC family protein n=1 Tax=Belliella kenyensis TaxID=1472724 RepID=A0ABV8EQM6_9BACT|nr:hypothetical protein [Belliella kenyensis]MCH7402937.1 hypothetical protein [Belliella kenyensis]MDN3602643.1 hypothetical protein [Belliella kenyensis]
MEKKDIYSMTDEELLIEKKNLRNSKIFHALAIGFLAGIFFVGIVAWGISSKMNFGMLIPLMIPVFLIYKLAKKPDTSGDLVELLKKRGLY